jgi:diacylglycerol O-acyltransferase / wax synthase
VPERMSPIGAIMWGVGRDTSLRMIVSNLILLDRVPARSDLADRLAAAAATHARLRQRPDALPGIRTRPAWIEEEAFDAARHIRTMAVPLPGVHRQVLDLVTLLEPSPFDPGMSPWDVTIIEGLEGGRAALYLRAHHCLTDGLHGVSILRMLVDRAARPAPPPEPVHLEAGPDEPAAAFAEQDHADSAPMVDLTSRRKPGTVSVTIDIAGAIHPFANGVSVAASSMSSAANSVSAAANGVSSALREDPFDIAVRGVQRGLEVASSVSRQVIVTGGRLSPLTPSHSMNTHFETFSVPNARTIARGLGGSRNDLLVAGAAIGLGLYHERLGISCPELRLASPARWRSGTGGGGSVVPTRVEIPAANGHPGPLFGVIAERLARSRREPALHATEMLASAISYLPTRVLMPALRAQANSVDFVATSLPGVRNGQHICGALIEESYPLGPRLGSLMNITAFGVDDRLSIGMGLDPVAISEPEKLVDCMLEAFQSFAGPHGS